MKNSVRDAHTPQPLGVFFNTMRYRGSEKGTKIGILSEQCQLYKDPTNVLNRENNVQDEENGCKDEVLKQTIQ